MQVAVKPRMFRDYRLKFTLPNAGGELNYEKHVSSVGIVPNSSIVTWQGGTPDASYSGVTVPTWTAPVEYAQDWETADSFSQFLLAHAGEEIPCEFRPLGADGPAFDAVVIITPGAIGGAINAVGTASVTLGVQGQPDFTPAAVPAA